MLNVDLQKLMKDGISPYELVTATAKRARMIVDESLKDGVVVEEKPVSLAVSELSADEWSVVPKD
jgi:DNA-directed RNA polymerase omega subunit